MMAFNTCLQDESSGNLLQVNTTTGEYLFTNCSGLALSGTAQATVRGSIVTLQQIGPNWSPMVKLDASQHKGTAVLRLLTTGAVFSIVDRDTRNNTCTCDDGSSANPIFWR
jgi:hypothetical protein